MRFENRIAVVAGGTKGIGRAVTLALAKEGAIVEAWGRDAAAMEEVKRAAEAFEGKVSCAKVDVTDYAAVEAAVQKVVDTHGRVDFMISCVGGGTFKQLVDYTPEFWQNELNYNLNTVFNSFHTALKHMVAQNYGRLVCFMSTTGGVPGLTGYAAAKAGCKALIETIKAEYSRQHITANAVLPSFTPTPWTMKAFDDTPEGKARYDAIVNRMPLGPNTVENVADTVLYLLDNERISAQIIGLM